MHSDSDIDVRDKIKEIEEYISKVETEFNTFKKDNSEHLANTIQELSDKLESISSKISTQNKKIEDGLSQAQNNLTDAINKNIFNIDRQLKNDFQNNLTELNGKFETQLTAHDAQFNKIVAKSGQEIDAAIELKKSDLDNFKEKIDNQISDFQTKAQTNLSSTIDKFKGLFLKAESTRDEEYKDLKARIESLLPEAAALGIAKAFEGAKTSRLWAMIINQVLSYVTIIVIFIFACIFYSDNSNLLSELFKANSSEYGKILITFLRFLALETPLCWLAVYTAKKAHQNQRVYEEYAHKYATALTYVGFAKETKDNPTTYGEKAVENLTDGFRDAVFRNPSEVIDKKIEITNPLVQLVEAVGNLSKENLDEFLKFLQSLPKKS